MAQHKRRRSAVDLFKQAIEANDMAQLKFVLKYHRAKINGQDEEGVTVLHQSCLSGHIEIVRLLVDNGAELELRDDRGWTCLHYAAFGGHVDVVNFLINSCVNVTALSLEGKLAIDVAKGEGIVFLLASAILRAGKEHLLLRYMDGSTSSLHSLQSNDEDRQKWQPVQESMSEEVMRVSQQCLAPSLSAYLDEKFNLNTSLDKSTEAEEPSGLPVSEEVLRVSQQCLAPSLSACLDEKFNLNTSLDKSTEAEEPSGLLAKQKVTRKTSFPGGNDPLELSPSKRAHLNSFNSSFSRDVLQRFAVSETNLTNEQVQTENTGADISRVPNFSDLNNVNSDTWIYSQ